MRTAAIATALSLALGATAGAVAPVGKPETFVATGAETPRAYRSVARSVPPQAQPAIDRIKAAGLGEVLWDKDTGTPSTLYGAGVPAPGANADATIAETAARGFLASHLGVLAPGALPGDFQLVANEVRGDLRAVGFAQTAAGLRVLGAQIGFVFSHDRLVIVTSTALPDAAAASAPFAVPTAVTADRLRTTAARWIGDATGKTPAATTVGAQAILPVVHRRTASGVDVEYHVVHPVAVSLVDAVGAWEVYVDSATAAPIARRNLIRYAQGVVSYNVPDRNPQQSRSPHPAAHATHTVNGNTVTSTADGHVNWTGGGAATVSPGLLGPTVQIHNEAGAIATTSLSLPAGGTVTWDESGNEAKDAQLSAFIFANAAKDYVKVIAPSLAWLDGRIDVYVNEPGNCNAYSNGDDIHFFPADGSCENTARIADVVYHEFGHSVHANAIIPGVGNFAGDVSEGVSDFLAATITDDHGMGRGFFFDTNPLRDLDPVGNELVYPDDITGEVHADGEIIGEALWDLRKALIAELGAAQGRALAEKIWYHILEVSVDLPSTYAAALAADDDDGNLGNGTPHECTIGQAFATHGLADGTFAAIGLGTPTVDGLTITVPVEAPAAATCPAPTVQGGTLAWKERGASGPGTSIDLVGTDTGGGAMAWAATIPAQADGTVVTYQLSLQLSNGSVVQYPDNPADPWYELYVGPVEEIWCDDFESGGTGWTHGADAGTDEWQIGTPGGLSEDPATAFDGSNVLGMDLSTNGEYRSDSNTWAKSPVIDVTGKTGVRLQYRRWLGVEDGFWDHATISVDGTAKWTNADSMQGNASNVAHRDHEWRFQDVDLATEAADGSVQLEFRLESDQALQFGGWTIDRVCVVAQGAAAGDVCGDGQITGSEACDDGNTTPGDGCSATCQDETTDPPPEEDGGCCQTNTGPASPLALGLFTLGALMIRRRRRRRV